MKLEEIDKIRKDCSIKVSIYLIMFFVSFIFIGICSMSTNGWIAIPIILLLVSIAGISKTYITFSKIKSEFKNKYLKPIIKEIYENAEYNPDNGLGFRYILNSRIVPRGDRFSSSDLITGSIHDVKFKTCDVHVEERHTSTTKNGTTTYYVTIFLGRFFEFEFNKEFCETLLVHERLMNINESGLHSTKLESIDFNKKFKTCAQTDHGAFYLLTPQVQERLLEIENKYEGKCAFSFVNNKFYFALNNGIDTFELKLFESVNDTILTYYINDIKMMEEIVETLKLNKNLFK